MNKNEMRDFVYRVNVMKKTEIKKLKEEIRQIKKNAEIDVIAKKGRIAEIEIASNKNIEKAKAFSKEVE